jgi:hypothetical protein
MVLDNRKERKMKKMMALGWVLGSIMGLMGCNGGGGKDSMSKDDAKNMSKTDTTTDFCEIYQWYGDGVCDTFCVNPDPDCGNNAFSCTTSDDCTMIQAGCCGCKAEGRQDMLAVSKKAMDEGFSPDRPDCGNMMCPQVWDCVGLNALCITGNCTLVDEKDSNVECSASGGTAQIGPSCNSDTFPNTCVAGMCAPGSSVDTVKCYCPQGQCFDGVRCLDQSQP